MLSGALGAKKMKGTADPHWERGEEGHPQQSGRQEGGEEGSLCPSAQRAPITPTFHLSRAVFLWVETPGHLAPGTPPPPIPQLQSGRHRWGGVLALPSPRTDGGQGA